MKRLVCSFSGTATCWRIETRNRTSARQRAVESPTAMLDPWEDTLKTTTVHLRWIPQPPRCPPLRGRLLGMQHPHMGPAASSTPHRQLPLQEKANFNSYWPQNPPRYLIFKNVLLWNYRFNVYILLKLGGMKLRLNWIYYVKFKVNRWSGFRKNCIHLKKRRLEVPFSVVRFLWNFHCCSQIFQKSSIQSFIILRLFVFKLWAPHTILLQIQFFNSDDFIT